MHRKQQIKEKESGFRDLIDMKGEIEDLKNCENQEMAANNSKKKKKNQKKEVKQQRIL